MRLKSPEWLLTLLGCPQADRTQNGSFHHESRIPKKEPQKARNNTKSGITEESHGFFEMMQLQGMEFHAFREISCVSWFQLLFSG